MNTLARDWLIFDLPERQRSLSLKDGHALVELTIDGMHCGACAQAIEKGVGTLPGVSEIRVSAATGNAQIRWDLARLPLSRILVTIAGLGFEPSLIHEQLDQNTLLERRTAYKRLAVAGFGMMQVMTFAFGLYAGALEGIEAQYELYLRLVSMLVTIPVVLYSAVPFFSNAWRDLLVGRLGMDLPVSAAILLALAASIVNTLLGTGEVYFDSVTMFVFFLLIGRMVEMHARHHAGTVTQALARLLPPSAVRLEAGVANAVPVSALQVGDVLLVAAGQTVPADGIVIAGSSRLDESMLTGEATPLSRKAGDAVMGGSLNVAQPLQIQVTALGPQTVLSSIVRLLSRAQAERPRLARAADGAAANFVAWILAAAFAVGALWFWFDSPRAFPALLAVLVVTCPCALSLATPAAVAAATRRLARLRLLVTRADAIEALAHVRVCVLDKTGTLTSGQPRIARTYLFGDLSGSNCLAIASALEMSSEHPLAQAFAQPLTTKAEVAATDLQVTSGAGIEGTVQGVRYRIGSLEYAAALSTMTAPQSIAGATIFLSSSDGILAGFEINDSLRPDAVAAVDELRDLGIEVRIASGDHRDVVARVAEHLGVEQWRARLTPQDKLAYVKSLAAGGGVLMVGDGINDAPVLNAASVSVAMGSGSALAQASADFISTANSLQVLATGVREARRTLGVIRQNLAWAFGYNLLAIPLAALGLVPPWAAAIGMSASSMLVVLNARRLRKPARAPRDWEKLLQGIVWPVSCC